MPRLLLRCVPAVTLLVLVAAPAARADAPDVIRNDIPARARALAERGRKHHDEGNYAAAIAAFTEAYALAPSPALLFNLAQSYRLGGHCDDAATMYKRFLATDPPADARALAETHLISVEQCAEALRPVSVPGPGPATPPGTSSLTFLRSPREPRAHVESDVGIGLGLGGGLALVGALGYELRAHSASQQVSDAYAAGAAGKTIVDLDKRGRHDALVADVLGVTGVAAVGAGVALYYLGTRDERASHVAVIPTIHGAEVHAAWRF